MTEKQIKWAILK